MTTRFIFHFAFFSFCASTLISQTASTVNGRVLDETGKPLEGVGWMISATEDFHDGHWFISHRSGVPRTGVTDKDGRFVLTYHDRHRYDVQFQKPGFAPCFLFEVSPETPEIELVMKRGQSIVGTVVRSADGKKEPIAMTNVTLRLLIVRGFAFQQRAMTDSSGKFEFRVSAPPVPPPLNLLEVSGKVRQEAPRKVKWQVDFAGEIVEIDLREGEPVTAVDFDASAIRKKPLILKGRGR